jgi:site-specific recombinase XerD
MTIEISPVTIDGTLFARLRFEAKPDVLRALGPITSLRWGTSDTECLFLLNNKGYFELYRKLRDQGFYVDYSKFKGDTSETVRQDKRSLSAAQKTIIRKYVSYLKGLRLSKSTIMSYFGFVADFVEHCGEDSLFYDQEDVRLFIEHKSVGNYFSVSTHRQCISALKHFSFFYPDCSIDIEKLSRPKRSKYLPRVISQEAVISLIASATNIKHRLIIALLYSSGMRVGELISLEIKDIDVHRRQIFVYQSKGRKDRVITLAESIIPLLENYITAYTPVQYVIENPKRGPYSASSIRQFLHRLCKKVGISGRVTPHTLRHSYATHLIEQGVGLRHVQELLGHAKPETTMIYTHVARKDLLSIKSPLDTALNKIQSTTGNTQKLPNSNNLIG